MITTGWRQHYEGQTPNIGRTRGRGLKSVKGVGVQQHRRVRPRSGAHFSPDDFTTGIQYMEHRPIVAQVVSNSSNSNNSNSSNSSVSFLK